MTRNSIRNRWIYSGFGVILGLAFALYQARYYILADIVGILMVVLALLQNIQLYKQRKSKNREVVNEVP